MKKLMLIVFMLVSATGLWAESVWPKGFPADGLETRILSIDSTDYLIEADGLIHKVVRSAKIMTSDLKRIFLFQIKEGAGAVLVKDQKGIVIEIWLLPSNYQVTED